MPARRTWSRIYTSGDGMIARAGRVAGDTTMVEMRVQIAAISERLVLLPDHERRIREVETANAQRNGARLLLAALAASAPGWLALVIMIMHHGT